MTPKLADAEKQSTNKHAAAKQDLFRAFLKDHKLMYASMGSGRVPVQCRPNLCYTSPEEAKRAMKQQGDAVAAHAEDGAQSGRGVSKGLPQTAPADAEVRALFSAELLESPLDMATRLIAESGVWRSKEQYLVTLFTLQPAQQAWERARREGHQTPP